MDPNEPFEVDLAETLGEAMRADERRARAVYGALCNVDWQRADGRTHGCTWHQASEVVSGIRDQGDHDLEFYLSGNEGTVAPEVAAALATRGWRPAEDA